MPLLDDPRLFAPVLDAFVRGIPHAFRDIAAEDGTQVRLRITGDAGGEWSLLREKGAWRLVKPLVAEPDASVEIDADTAWRLFTKGLTPEEAKGRATLNGYERLAEQVLNTVSIIA